MDNSDYTEDFRENWCRYCINNRNTTIGFECGLPNIPSVESDFCPEYVADRSYMARVDKGDFKREEKRFSNYWHYAFAIITVASLASKVIFDLQLKNNYRWTLSKAEEIDTRFSFNIPPKKKVLTYRYRIEGKVYLEDHDLEANGNSHESLLDGFYFIQFNPQFPSNSRIPKLNRVDGYIKIHHFPDNGIHKDSLDIFLSKLRLNLKLESSTSTEY